MDPAIVALWFGGASLVLQAISMIPREAKNRTADDEAALEATSEAYYGTERYYALAEEKRTVEGQLDLAFKWERAAILLRKYDDTLYDRLSAKSEYWKRGGTWSEDAIKAAGIGLQSIKREVGEKLQKSD